MAEETRTTRVNIEPQLAGEADFGAGVARLVRALTGLEQANDKFVQSQNSVDASLKAGTGSWASLAKSINTVADSTSLDKYTQAVVQLVAAYKAGGLTDGAQGFLKGLKDISGFLPTSQKNLAYTNAEALKLVSTFDQLVQSSRDTAAADTGATTSLATRTRALAAQSLATERLTVVTNEQVAAAQRLERLQVQNSIRRSTGLDAAPASYTSSGSRTNMFGESVPTSRSYTNNFGATDQAAMTAAILDGLKQRETAALGLVAKYDKVTAAAGSFRLEEEKLAQALKVGDITAQQYSTAMQGIGAAQLKISDDVNGVTAAISAQNKEMAESASRLERLRSSYGTVETAAEKASSAVREATAQLKAGNIRLPEYMSITSNIQASTVSAPRVTFNPAMLAEGAGSSSNVAKHDADMRRLAVTYGLVSSALDQLNADEKQLNDLIATAGPSTARYQSMLVNLTDQKKRLVEQGGQLNNSYQRQQILQAGLVNTFQSLAAGGGVMQTLFIQSTQLIGAFGSVNLALLAIASAGLIGVGVFAGIGRAVATVGDQAVMAEARIEALTGSARRAREAYDSLRLIGQSTGVSANESSGVFSRLLVGADQIGATQQQVLDLTRMFQQLGIIGGGSTQQINAGMQQFAQSMSKGKLDGDELRSVMENIPLVVRALGQELGVSNDQLRTMGEQGKLTSQVVFDALLRQSQQVNQQFAQMPVTMERGWNQLQVAIEAALVDMNRFLGLSESVGVAFARGALGVQQLRLSMGGGSPQEQVSADEAERVRLRAALNAQSTRTPLVAYPGMFVDDQSAGGAPVTAEQNAAILRFQRIAPQDTSLLGRGFAAYGASEIARMQARLAELDRKLGGPAEGTTAQVSGAIDNANSIVGRQNNIDPAVEARLKAIRDRLSSNNTTEGIQLRYSQRVTEANSVTSEFSREQTSLQTQRGVAVQNGDTTEAARIDTRLTTVRQNLALATNEVKDAEHDRDSALQALNASGNAAAAREDRRVQSLRNDLQRMDEAMAEVGSSREVRSFGNLAEKMNSIYVDRNTLAGAGDVLTSSNETLNRSLADQARRFTETNRAIDLQTQALTDKTQISQLEATGTRAAMVEIDRITKLRQVEQTEIERANALLVINNGLRATEAQIMRMRADGATDANPALRQLQNEQALLIQQRDTLNAAFDNRVAAINDPNNGRVAQEFANQTRSALDSATKASSDFFFDAMTGKISSIGSSLKTTLLRAVADGISKEVIRPIIAPIIQAGVGALGSVFGGSGGGAMGALSSLGGTAVSGLNAIWRGVGLGDQTIPESNAASTSDAMTSASRTLSLASAGRFGNLGNAFTNQGLSNTGYSFVDNTLNTQLISGNPAAYDPTALTGSVNIVGDASGGYQLVPVGGGSTGGLSLAGGLGAGASILGGAYSIYGGIQKGGIGGGVGVAGGVAGVAGGAAVLGGAALGATAAAGSTMAGVAAGLSAAGPIGMAIAAVLAIVAALLPGEKASGKGQETRISLDDGSITKNGLTGKRFSAGNSEQATSAAQGIADLSAQIGQAFNGVKLGGEVAVGATASRGDGLGQLYLDVNGKKGQFQNDETGAKDLADRATQYLLESYRDKLGQIVDSIPIDDMSRAAERKTNSDYRGIATGSGNDLQALFNNLDWYKNIYLKFGTDPVLNSAYADSLNQLNATFDAAAEKAQSLYLSMEPINQQRDKEILLLKQQRDLQLNGIYSALDIRTSKASGVPLYDTYSKLSMTNRDQTWAQEVDQLQKQLADLGETASETASRIAQLKDTQLAEYNKAVTDQLGNLDNSLAMRRMRAQGNTAGADALQRQISAQKEIDDLTTSLATLGVSSDVAAQKIADTWQVLALERDQANSANGANSTTAQSDATSVVVDLQKYIKSLTTSTAAPGTLLDRFTAANDDFQQTSISAKGGDAKAIRNLQSVAETYRDLASQIYGGGQGYADAITAIGAAAGSVVGMGDAALSNSFFAESLQTTTDVLKSAIDGVTSAVADLNAQVASLTAENAAQRKELNALLLRPAA